MFSRRTRWAPSNTWSVAVAKAQAAGRPLLNLTEANPTVCGFDYSGARLEALNDPAAHTYAPDPQGMATARAAVVGYYAKQHSLMVDPANIMLTAGTSEAYSYLFKLLCDPGDAVLAPQPSYPLFEYLAGLDGVSLVPYPLRYDGVWSIDFPALEMAITPRTRAIIVVHPHNPTGAFIKRSEARRLVGLCWANDMALISDEVFLDYVAAADPERSPSFVSIDDVLTATLSGLSKVTGLPGVKASWLAVSGPPDVRSAALDRLQIIADTYLSVSTPVQLALPRVLPAGAAVRHQIAARVAENRAVLVAALAGPLPLDLLPAEGGWYATLRLPDLQTEEAWALQILEDGVLIHPGYFFDFAFGPLVILSLLPLPEVFAEGVGRLVQRVQATVDAAQAAQEARQKANRVEAPPPVTIAQPDQTAIDQFVGAAHGNFDQVRALLAQYPMLVNIPSRWGETAIQAAAQVGRRDIVEFLLARGAPWDICTAAVLGANDTVRSMLWSNPALIHATGAHGIPLLYYPVITGNQALAEWLLTQGAPINAGLGSSTPLHGAVLFGPPVMIQWLLARGADPSLTDSGGNTPLQVALANNNTAATALLYY